MKLAIIVPSQLPVPSVKGGAIETLVTGLINKNEEKRLLDITIFSTYNKEAVFESKKYLYTCFIWIRYNLFNKIINIATHYYSKISRKPIPHFGVLQIIYHLKKFQFDLVVIEGNEQVIIPLYKVVGKSKILFHLHSATLFSTPEVFNFCKKIIVVSNYIKNLVLMKTQRTDKDVVVLQNCTDIPVFCRKNNLKFREIILSKYHISEDDVVICFTGRIDKQKGIKELMQALLQIPDNLPFKLIIAGSTGLNFGLSNIKTEFYSEVLNLAKNLGNKVIFAGFIRNVEIPQILVASDISVVPSLGEDAAPLTIFESLAAGLPIVTTDSGGIPEYITDKCAIVVKRDENFIKNLSSAIQKLIISKEKREAMGDAGFIHVQKYNYDNYYTDFLKILTESNQRMQFN
jgi:glycosyltransferase involved in cell wall biosynthesis